MVRAVSCNLVHEWRAVNLFHYDALVRASRFHEQAQHVHNVQQPSADFATLIPLISRRYDWTSIYNPPERHRYVLHVTSQRSNAMSETRALTLLHR